MSTDARGSTGAPAVAVESLTKRFGDLLAVDGVSFDVADREIFGIIGPNGAGKTTLMECLEGLQRRTSGAARVLGADPDVADPPRGGGGGGGGPPPPPSGGVRESRRGHRPVRILL